MAGSGTLAFCFDLQSEMLHWVTVSLRERDKDPPASNDVDFVL